MNQSKKTIINVNKDINYIQVNHKGLRLKVQKWLSKDPNKHTNTLIIVADIWQKISYYSDLAASIAEQNINVYIYSQITQNDEKAKNLHISDFDKLPNYLLQIVASINHKEKKSTKFLLGQGFAATIIMKFIKKHPNLCSGIILSAPCFKLKYNKKSSKIQLIHNMAKMLSASTLPSFLNPRFIKNYYKICAKYDSKHRKYSNLLVSKLIKTTKEKTIKFDKFKEKFFIVCPENDEICDYQDIKIMFRTYSKHNLQVINLEKESHDYLTEINNIKLAKELLLDFIENINNKTKNNENKDELTPKIEGASAATNTKKQPNEETKR